jgi:hypothetical protein
MMRPARMMFVFVLMLFALAAAAPSWAQQFSVTLDGKRLTVFDKDETGHRAVTDERGKPFTCTVKEGDVNGLKILFGGKEYPIHEDGIADGVVITTGPGHSCVWRFLQGRWIQICN